MRVRRAARCCDRAAGPPPSGRYRRRSPRGFRRFASLSRPTKCRKPSETSRLGRWKSRHAGFTGAPPRIHRAQLSLHIPGTTFSHVRGRPVAKLVHRSPGCPQPVNALSGGSPLAIHRSAHRGAGRRKARFPRFLSRTSARWGAGWGGDAVPSGVWCDSRGSTAVGPPWLSEAQLSSRSGREGA